jgi:hypothetical protein
MSKITVWTEITFDCPVILFGVQRKSPRRDVVRIRQREKETLQTRVCLVAVVLLPALPVHSFESTAPKPSRLCEEFQFGELSERLSQFRESDEFKEDVTTGGENDPLLINFPKIKHRSTF